MNILRDFVRNTKGGDKMCSLETTPKTKSNLKLNLPGIKLLRFDIVYPDSEPCLPVKEFLIEFGFKEEYPSKKTWQSFREIVQVIEEWISGEGDLVVYPIAVAFTDESRIMFGIYGHEKKTYPLSDPDDNNETGPVTGSEPA